jgi:translation elongation factor EF-1beta
MEIKIKPRDKKRQMEELHEMKQKIMKKYQ